MSDQQESSSSNPRLDRVVNRFSVKGDQGKLSPLDTVGGWRGLLEAVLPGLVYVVVFSFTFDLWFSLGMAGVIALVFTAVRLIQRQSLVQALSGLLGLGLSALLTRASGRPEDFFLPGLISNSVWIVLYVVSIFIRWPIAGLLFALIRGEGVEWRRDPRRVRAYNLATLILITLLALRLVTKIPLYLSGELVALGIVHTALGLPAYLLALWLGWVVSQPRVLETDTAQTAQTEGPSDHAELPGEPSSKGSSSAKEE